VNSYDLVLALICLAWLLGVLYFCRPRQIHHCSRMKLSIFLPGVGAIRGFDEMDITLTATQELAIGAIPVDARGNPAPVDGEAVWAVSDESLGTLVDAEGDDLEAGAEKVFKAAGPTGNVQVTCTVDADLGEGVRTLTAIWNINIAAAEAVSFGQYTGTPREQTFE
jgi:hypothetical protein